MKDDFDKFCKIKERMTKMKVTFIKHSCYFVELNTCCLLFDYYEGDVPHTDKPLFVFASHSHGDHFSTAVFDINPGGETTYLLSDDIFEIRVPQAAKDRTVFVSAHETHEIGELKIATLNSTDMGVAFLVQCEGKLIYHAGDLNCWVWDGAPKFQNDAMTAQYKNELELLNGKKIDVAFVPLDPRQEADFDLGMKYFLEAADAEKIFPMHMWGDFSVVPLFKSTPTYRAVADKIMNVSKEGQEFVL